MAEHEVYQGSDDELIEDIQEIVDSCIMGSDRSQIEQIGELDDQYGKVQHDGIQFNHEIH